MPYPVYTERLAANASNGTVATFTVPPGKRAIVTSLSSACTQASTGKVYLQAAGYTLAVQSYQAIGSQAATCRVAVYAGETISVYLEGGVGIQGVIGGYLFDDLAQAKAPELERGPAEFPLALPVE